MCVAHLLTTDFGGHSDRVTPVPIPNTEVKPVSADGTWGLTPWESRTPPDFARKGASLREALFVVFARSIAAVASDRSCPPRRPPRPPAAPRRSAGRPSASGHAAVGRRRQAAPAAAGPPAAAASMTAAERRAAEVNAKRPRRAAARSRGRAGEDRGPHARAVDRRGRAARRGRRTRPAGRRRRPQRPRRQRQRGAGHVGGDRRRRPRRAGGPPCSPTALGAGPGGARPGALRRRPAHRHRSCSASCPNVAAVHEVLGLAAYRSGRWKQAATELETAQQLHPTVELLPVLADVYRAQRRWADVERVWDGRAGGVAGAGGARRGPHRRRRRPGRPGRPARGAAHDGPRRRRCPKRVRDHHLRQWYVLGDLHDRAGDTLEATGGSSSSPATIPTSSTSSTACAPSAAEWGRTSPPPSRAGTQEAGGDGPC